jgi:hypothetical protein
MVGDSVVGCLLQSPGDVTNLPARFYKLVRCSSYKPGRQEAIWPVDSLILSYRLGVPNYPERCPKKETFLFKAPLFEPLSNFAAAEIVKREDRRFETRG